MLGLLSLQTHGFDLSYYQGDVSQDTMNCLSNNGMNFAIFQAQIGSTVSPYAVTDYHRAKAAGINYVDFYVFPTMSKDPRYQARETISYLRDQGVLNGNMVWLDIENHDLFYASCGDNQWFVSEWLDEAANQMPNGRKGVGIYSNWVQWNDIMCGWTGASSYDLWYPHYDNWESFGDFQPFGGWYNPNIKQYAGDLYMCSTALDKNFY